MKITGSILIKSIYGRNGAFNVGTLSTEIGEFVVKNELLDQFEEGQYDVNVLLSQIYMGGFNWGHTKRVTELCASIEHIECVTEVEKLPDSLEVFGEIDPAEEESEAETPLEFSEEADEDDNQPGEILGDALLKVFLANESFALDATVGRLKIRSQSNWLKSNGYRYNGKSRLWEPAG